MVIVIGLVVLWASILMANDVSPLVGVSFIVFLIAASVAAWHLELKKQARAAKKRPARRPRAKPNGLPTSSSKKPAYVPPPPSRSSSSIPNARNPAMRSTIDTALDSLPAALLNRSGSVFYTGPEAFKGIRPVYLLGLNPGGSPIAQSAETIGKSIESHRTLTRPWSAYSDESWAGAPPGTWGLQPRVLHMLRELDLDPRLTPASNVVFVRSATEAGLQAEKNNLLDVCWPVHQAVIDTLAIKTIICFGGTAGKWVRDRGGASQLVDIFRETNARGWKSEAHRAPNGQTVLTVTHPGRVDWRNPAADPTPLVMRVLASQGK